MSTALHDGRTNAWRNERTNAQWREPIGAWLKTVKPVHGRGDEGRDARIAGWIDRGTGRAHGRTINPFTAQRRTPLSIKLPTGKRAARRGFPRNRCLDLQGGKDQSMQEKTKVGASAPGSERVLKMAFPRLPRHLFGRELPFGVLGSLLELAGLGLALSEA